MSEADISLVDSCLKFYHATDIDTLKINTLSVIVEGSWDDKLWPKYNLWLLNETQQLLEQKKYTASETFLLKKRNASAISNHGFYLKQRGESQEAIKYYQDGLKLRLELDLKPDIANSYTNIGVLYYSQGLISEALDYYHKALNIQEEIEDTVGMGTTLNNIGALLKHQENYKSALNYYKKALEIKVNRRDNKGIANLFNNIGAVYKSMEEYEKALDYYQKSLALRKEIGNKKKIALALNNLGTIYKVMGSADTSLLIHKEAFEMFEKIGSKAGLAQASGNLGKLYYDLGDIDEAFRFALMSMNLSKELGYPNNIRTNANLLYAIYQKKGQWEKALEMHKLKYLMRDSINSKETHTLTIQREARYQYDKQKELDDAENDKLLAVEKEAQARQKVISFTITGGLILVFLFLIFIFRQLRVTRKQKTLIEKAHLELADKNQEITDSITYAKRIQDAILPEANLVKELLPRSFVFYQPKDIVAGDFYWVESKEEYVLFAAADCTGHGVPGAMVSVVCHTALNRVFRDYNLLDPGKILDKTREIVIEQLSKSSVAKEYSMSNMNDGMDIALCVLNTKTNEISFAGAHNPLWIIRNGATEMEEVKASTQAIGSVENPIPFETHQVQLNKGDSIYVFSDGFADQFGGGKGKKIKSKPFKKLLLDNQQEEMDAQLTKMSNYFESWKGGLEQVDDVCVIGVRV